MKIFNMRLKIAVATVVLLAGCATTDDYYSRPPSVSGSVSVGYYDGYYNDPWYGNNCCYGGYPPVIIGPPQRPPVRPVPPIGNVPNRPVTLPAQVNRPASRPAPRPMPMPRPTARPRR